MQVQVQTSTHPKYITHVLKKVHGQLIKLILMITNIINHSFIHLFNIIKYGIKKWNKTAPYGHKIYGSPCTGTKFHRDHTELASGKIAGNKFSVGGLFTKKWMPVCPGNGCGMNSS